MFGLEQIGSSDPVEGRSDEAVEKGTFSDEKKPAVEI
jgi:hypothetical protein